MTPSFEMTYIYILYWRISSRHWKLKCEFVNYNFCNYYFNCPDSMSLAAVSRASVPSHLDVLVHAKPGFIFFTGDILTKQGSKMISLRLAWPSLIKMKVPAPYLLPRTLPWWSLRYRYFWLWRGRKKWGRHADKHGCVKSLRMFGAVMSSRFLSTIFCSIHPHPVMSRTLHILLWRHCPPIPHFAPIPSIFMITCLGLTCFTCVLSIFPRPPDDSPSTFLPCQVTLF